MGGIVGGHGDGHIKAVGIARIGQQGLGLLHVVGVVIGQAVVKILAKGGVHAGADEASVSVEGQVQDLLAIHGIAQGLAHPHIVKGLFGVIEVKGLHQVHGALGDVEIISQLGGPGAGHMGAQIHRPALKAHEDAVGILHDLEGHLVQLGGDAPVVLKPLQHHIVLGGTGDVLERAGAHRRGVLPVIVPGQNGGGEVGEKLVVRLGDGDGHRLVVQGGHIGDGGKGLHQRGAALRVGAALDRPDHVVHSHSLPIMELHPVAQSEGISRSIVRDGIVRGHRGDQVAVCGGLYKPFKHVEHDLFRPCRHRHVGVKAVVQVLGDGHRYLVGSDGGSLLEGLLGRRSLGGVAAAAGQDRRQQPCGDEPCDLAFCHTDLPFVTASPSGSQCGADDPRPLGFFGSIVLLRLAPVPSRRGLAKNKALGDGPSGSGVGLPQGCILHDISPFCKGLRTLFHQTSTAGLVFPPAAWVSRWEM